MTKRKPPRPATPAERQRRRLAALDAIAQAHGYATWGRLGTAVRQGRARLEVTRLSE